MSDKSAEARRRGLVRQEFRMLFGGIALVVLGVILLGVQSIVNMRPKEVRNPSPESSIEQIEHKANPMAGIVGIVSLAAGVAVFVMGWRADKRPRD
jgi:hypothetical protein